MGDIKVSIEDELLRKFREEAMRRFGYTKGSLSIAAREAISKWLETERPKEEVEEFKRIIRRAAGIWKGEGGYRYVRKVRRESEERLRRLGL